MGSYVPATSSEQQEMLEAIGLRDFRELYGDVPEEMYLRAPLDIPEGLSELEVSRKLRAMAAKNHVFSTVLRGAGAYDHYIPSVVSYIPAKEEFLTAYTPYQAEMSQGLLQSIFEYQTMICRLTGMEVSNASVYDGATAAAEAAAMCRDRKRRVTLVSAAAHPDTIETIATYCYGVGEEMRLVPARDGKTDPDALRRLLTPDVASFYVQQPNFYGQLEDAEALGQLVHEAGAMYIMGCNPISLAILKTPRACGADIAVGEGQLWDCPWATAARTWVIWPQPGTCESSRAYRRPDGRAATAPPSMCCRSGPGAAYTPGKGQQQHLLQRGAVRFDGQRLYGDDGSSGDGGGRPAIHGQSALFGQRAMCH